MTANKVKVSFGDDENVLQFTVVIVVQLSKYTTHTDT